MDTLIIYYAITIFGFLFLINYFDIFKRKKSIKKDLRKIINQGQVEGQWGK